MTEHPHQLFAIEFTEADQAWLAFHVEKSDGQGMLPSGFKVLMFWIR